MTHYSRSLQTTASSVKWAVNEALERAAKECDNAMLSEPNGDFRMGLNTGISLMASGIRNLKG